MITFCLMKYQKTTMIFKILIFWKQNACIVKKKKEEVTSLTSTIEKMEGELKFMKWISFDSKYMIY